MANIVKKIICDVGPMKVLGVCTDNAANMKKAWQLIVTEFPHKYPYGCLAHTLNLIFTDVSNLKSIADSQRNCTMVVKEIKNSQILSALLKQHQQKSGQIIQQSLKLPVTTRWASIIHCMESLHNNRLALRGLAIDDEATSLAKPIQNLLLSEVFWDKVDGFIKLLKPIAIAIAAVEGDKLSLSIVAKTFLDLEKSFQDNILCSPILKSEENAMMEIIAKRRKFHIRNIHLAANLVDPRYKGCHISGDEMIDAIETLHKLGKMDSSIKECDDKILGEIADYRSSEGLFAKPFIWASVKHSSPVSWWKGICCSCAPILSNIASKILLLSPTSAAVERSFSRQSWIHNQKRNRLTNDRASKLVFISHNLQLKNLKCNAESSTSQSQEFFLDNGTSQSLESEVSSDSEEYGFDFTIEDLNEQESQNTESFVN
ncbi:uncharacterized protein LOC136090221 [Hydra vulgaris]|uniref:Uncharacterized protein LOC136090221 n=1 Tax=Hydra vulgaris TaxID=6087 RepID=A0ABM4DDK2_HYDVU